MLGLPQSTEISKQLPKKTIFDRLQLKYTVQDRFDADVSKIFIVNAISPATIPAIGSGEKVKSIYVIQVILKKKDFNPVNIQMLEKAIHQRMVLALQFEGMVKMGVYRTRMVYSDWMPVEQANIQLQGTNLDVIWDNIAASIGGIEIEEGNTVDEQIIADDARAKLIRDIDSLEAKARAEKQPRRKLEMFEKLEKMKKQLYG